MSRITSAIRKKIHWIRRNTYYGLLGWIDPVMWCDVKGCCTVYPERKKTKFEDRGCQHINDDPYWTTLYRFKVIKHPNYPFVKKHILMIKCSNCDLQTWRYEGTELKNYDDENKIKDYHKILKDAILLFGKDAQIDMAIEEAAELIDVIQKMKRKRRDSMHLLSEIVDNQIMLDQLRIMHSLDDSDFERIKNEKLKRLQSRIERRKINENTMG